MFIHASHPVLASPHRSLVAPADDPPRVAKNLAVATVGAANFSLTFDVPWEGVTDHPRRWVSQYQVKVQAGSDTPQVAATLAPTYAGDRGRTEWMVPINGVVIGTQYTLRVDSLTCADTRQSATVSAIIPFPTTTQDPSVVESNKRYLAVTWGLSGLTLEEFVKESFTDGILQTLFRQEPSLRGTICSASRLAPRHWRRSLDAVALFEVVVLAGCPWLQNWRLLQSRSHPHLHCRTTRSHDGR